ncbi:MAG: hypothetical protein IT300_18945 [Dehalococcoidia bacterium]|nr:hypothetical protein [Dehalococcoidia bacterium]
MAKIEEVRDKYEWPRLADAAQWVTAAEPALGWSDGTFLEVMQTNAIESAERALADDTTLVEALKERAGTSASGWTGTSTELLVWLDSRPERDARWPNRANTLSGKLNRIAPDLRKVGINVERFEQGSDSITFIRLTRVPRSIARTARTAREGDDQ